ncbi:50S ribosomal protein L22 [Coxiella endosymbiont of Amblyomma americanum]|uniref:50S ribosomal protein L22 n=1 Tax=Coxiella endosymbiont of Amblyomma americanum TaxID=325775 RepID=UPI00058006FA|nr:50S ribosomal protein L22 [Coxiella endosymbiont of Amblyomma americanum]AJC50428.1 50S ribosomal protein L22 [Coxiella endosymbiont of Amblyomma americanum]AUJ58768.1 50S ribosomal protein L22 [Coxiella-like endosymbiont of Amblyomma americanum]
MEVSARLKYARTSAQKTRLLANQIRGLSAERAVRLLYFSSKKAASIIRKVLCSAIANAAHNHGININELTVSTLLIDEGPVARRFRARARGRTNQILKRTCHITVKVSRSNTERKIRSGSKS